MLRLPAPSLIVLVGPGASGKSTWAAEHYTNSEIVSSDALRAVVGAGEHDQTASTAAFDLLERIIAERLHRGLTTVIDTLGFDVASRTRWVSLAHERGLPAHAVVFDTEPTLCEERNEARGRTIPKTALRKQFTRFKAVRSELDVEGWDGVHVEQPVAMVTPIVADIDSDERLSARPSSDDSGSGDHGHTFGLIVSRFDWDDEIGPILASIAQRAEAAGFRDVWVMDHFRQIRGVGRPWEDIPEAYTALAFMAGVTTTIRLGVMVTGVTHRHPIVLGKTIASLDALSGGRALCGLGIAWDEEEHKAYGIDFPDTATRYEILEDTLEMLPLLWGKGTPEYQGRHFQSPGLICYPRPLQDRIPILIGGSGEKRTLRLVAEHADACNVFGDPERVRHKARILHQHCADVGRDPGEIEVTHLTNALAASDRVELRGRVDALRDRNTTSEQYMKRNNAGTVDDLETLFGAYSDAGANHSIVAMPDVHRDGSIETFADVIARLGSP